MSNRFLPKQGTHFASALHAAADRESPPTRVTLSGGGEGLRLLLPGAEGSLLLPPSAEDRVRASVLAWKLTSTPEGARPRPGGSKPCYRGHGTSSTYIIRPRAFFVPFHFQYIQIYDIKHISGWATPGWDRYGG